VNAFDVGRKRGFIKGLHVHIQLGMPLRFLPRLQPEILTTPLAPSMPFDFAASLPLKDVPKSATMTSETTDLLRVTMLPAELVRSVLTLKECLFPR
jgi:hypothetical protein